MKLDSSKGHGLIFIISQPRSGSTMLQRILGAHPQIHTAGETWALFQPLRILSEVGSLDGHDSYHSRLNLKKFLADTPQGEEAYYEGMRRMYGHIFETALRGAQKEYFVEKVPRYSYVFPELYKTFPEAKYILLLRNPMAVLASIYNDWTGYHPKLLSSHTYTHDLITIPHLLINAMKMLKDDALVVRYKDLVKEPEKEMSRVMNYLGLDFFSEMIEYGKHNLPNWNFGDMRVYKHTRPAVSSIEKWKKTLKRPLFWLLARDYYSLLGPDTFRALGFDTDDIEKALKENKPAAHAILIRKIYWKSKAFFKKLQDAGRKLYRQAGRSFPDQA